MAEPLHQSLDHLACEVLRRALNGDAYTPAELRDLAFRLHDAAIHARAVEGLNVIPFDRPRPALRVVFPEARV